MNTTLRTLLFASLLAGTTSVFAESTYVENVGNIQADNALQEQQSVGIAFAYNQNIYDGVGNRIQPFPLLNLRYDNFFINGITAGYNLYQDESLALAWVVQPQFGGYNSNASDALDGMSDTSYLINTGLFAQYRLMPFVFTATALHDITGRSAGNSASAKIAVMVPLDDRRFVLIPSIAATWEDSDITGYYYGVSSSEATSSRPEYEPSTAVNLSYGLTMKYRMAEHWGATLGYVLTQYANDISDSPIVSRKYASTMLAGVSYLF